jgi:hypothetical protein
VTIKLKAIDSIRWNERQPDAERISFDSHDGGSDKGKSRELDTTAFNLDFGDFGPDSSIDPILRSLQSSESPLASIDGDMTRDSPESRDSKRIKVRKSQKRGEKTPPPPSPTLSDIERKGAEAEVEKGLKEKKKKTTTTTTKEPKPPKEDLTKRSEPSPHNMYRQNRSGAGQRIPWTEAEDQLFREELDRIYESGGMDQKARPWAAIMKVRVQFVALFTWRGATFVDSLCSYSGMDRTGRSVRS